MSNKIKTYVLTKKNLYEMNIAEFEEPMVFPSHASAYKEMSRQYNESLGLCKCYSEDETDIYNEKAVIDTGENIEEWQIYECEMEINNLNDFTSVYETLLTQYKTDFDDFINNIPQAMKMANALTDRLQKMQILLNAALLDCAGDKGGVDNIPNAHNAGAYEMVADIRGECLEDRGLYISDDGQSYEYREDEYEDAEKEPKLMFRGEAPRKFFENTILASRDTLWCAAYDEPRSFDWCDENCPKYSSCNTIAWADDELKLFDGEAWECAKCGSIVNNSDELCWKCNSKEELI